MQVVEVAVVLARVALPQLGQLALQRLRLVEAEPDRRERLPRGGGALDQEVGYRVGLGGVRGRVGPDLTVFVELDAEALVARQPRFRHPPERLREAALLLLAEGPEELHQQEYRHPHEARQERIEIIKDSRNVGQ